MVRTHLILHDMTPAVVAVSLHNLNFPLTLVPVKLLTIVCFKLMWILEVLSVKSLYKTIPSLFSCLYLYQ